MSTAKSKLLQYLNEAEAMEQAMVSTLQAHAAMTPRGAYREDVEEHLEVTRRHARAVRDRIGRMGWSFNPMAMGLGIVQTVAGQVISMGKAPLDLVRGMSLEEKMLKNAKDEAASEALEIATYAAIEALAREAGDDETARLAARHQADEERMFQRLMRHVPRLSLAVAGAEIHGRPQLDVTTVGAADMARSGVRRTRRRARSAARTAGAAASRAKRTARSTARAAEGGSRQAVAEGASAAGAAVRTASRATERAADRAESAVDAGTRRASRTATRQANRTRRAATSSRRGGAATAPRRKTAPRNGSAGREPWRGYDDQKAEEIASKVQELPVERRERVAEYESGHKDRRTVLEAAAPSGS